MNRGAGSRLSALCATLTPAARTALDTVRAVADEQSVDVYLVGGSVRDLLLGRAALDLDISCEGDARQIAGRVAARLGAPEPVTHPAFGTATVRANGVMLDLISARRERYAAPGALPTVSFAGLRDDLARRDFSINAMALGLNGPSLDQLIDPFAGADDLRLGWLRILHDASFRDDATRLLRAARYAARFRFRLEPHSARLAERDRAFLATISPERVRHELQRAFAEAQPARALGAMEQMGLPSALLPPLHFNAPVLAAYRRLPARAAHAGMPERAQAVAWLLPLLRRDAPALDGYIERFALRHEEATDARSIPVARAALDRLARWRTPEFSNPADMVGAGGARAWRTSSLPAPASAIVASLERLPVGALLAWSCTSARGARARIAAEYVDRLRHVRPLISAAELKALGVPEGPRFGEILRRLRADRLDAPGRTPDDERARIQDMLKQGEGD